MKKKKLKLNKRVKKVLSLFIFLALLTILVIALRNTFRHFYPVITENNVIYKYNVSKGVDYRVFLIENEFIDSDFLGMDKHYITELVEYIDLKLSYNFLGVGDIDLNYNYDIRANVIANFSGDAVTNEYQDIWNREFMLFTGEETNILDAEFNVEENLIIDLKVYNDMVHSFRQTFGIAPDAFLKLTMNIYIDGLIGEDAFREGDTVTINIPLGIKTFHIEKEAERISNHEILRNEEVPESRGYSVLLRNLLIIIIDGAIILWYTKKILYKEELTPYQMQVEKIKKEYDYRMVNVLNFINLQEFKFFEVQNFDELLDFVDEASGPILCWENKKAKNEETWFCIIKGKIIYRYILLEKSFHN